VAGKAKGKTRRITRKQALSYERSVPNAPMGVTSLVEVNGPDAYERRYSKTRKFLANAEKRDMAYTAKQRSAMKKMSPAREAAFKKMLSRSPARPNKPRKKPAARKAPAKKRVSKSQYMAAKKRAGRSPAQAESDWRRVRGLKPKKAVAKRKRAQKGSRAFGGYKPLKARLGPDTVRSYAYKTKKGNVRHMPTHAMLGYPSAASMRKAWGKGSGPDAAKIESRRRKLEARRSRAAGRAQKGLGLFTPNNEEILSVEEWREMQPNKPLSKAAAMRRGQKAARTRKRNARAKKRAAGRKAPKRRRVKKRGGKMSPAARRKISLALKRYHKTCKTKSKRAAPKRRRATPAAPKRRRKAAPKRKRAAKRKTSAREKYIRSMMARGHSRKQAASYWARKGKAVGGRRRKALAWDAAPPSAQRRPAKGKKARKRAKRDEEWTPWAARQKFAKNRRRRTYRKNVSGSAYVEELKNALKIGGMVTVGYVAHRALTKLLTDQLSKTSMYEAGSSLEKYKGLISSAIVTAIGVPLTVRAIPTAKTATAIAAGIAASFIHGAIVELLKSSDNEDAKKAATYLSAYPNAEGSAISPGSMGSYYLTGQGTGSYYTTQPGEVYSDYTTQPGEVYSDSGSSHSPMLSQAAAGYGDITDAQLRQAAAGYGQSPMLSQAAAGMGAELTQAAAGTGEYIAYNLSGIGEYEQTSVTMGRPSSTDEGIHPNLHSAEQAISQAEAAAGVGSANVPLQNTINPTVIADPIGDLPGGSRAGVFQGGDGIFG